MPLLPPKRESPTMSKFRFAFRPALSVKVGLEVYVDRFLVLLDVNLRPLFALGLNVRRRNRRGPCLYFWLNLLGADVSYRIWGE